MPSILPSIPPSPALGWGPGLILALLLAATATLSPLLGVPVYGRNFGHDANFALAALRHMDAAWHAGQPWPRWVMETNFGFGGTTFYTYPPLAYWAGAALRWVSGLSIAGTLGLAVALWRGLFLLGCVLWLRRHVPPPVALAAAALAALLPYPALINPWIRFAYAEIAGTALLPFLLLAIERAAERRDMPGIIPLALAFAALALTHLPTCSVAAHLAPIYALAYAGPRGLLPCLAGGAAGAGLAGCFVLPALGLLPETNAEGLDAAAWTGNLLLYGLPRGSADWLAFLLMVWAAAALAALAALGFRGLAGPAARTPLGRAALALLLAATALMTVVTLPAWLLLPELRSIQFPWRATSLLALPCAALAALALAAPAAGRWPRRLLLGLGIGCAALVPAHLALRVMLGHPGWPRFLPPEARLARALASPRGQPQEHLPAAARDAGWQAMWHGSETEPAPAPHPRPALPAHAERLPDGFLLRDVPPGELLLPQFHFPAWAAWDATGERLPVRAGRDGFLAIGNDRPRQLVQVGIVTTGWERLGWAVTGLTGLVLLGARLVGYRRAGRIGAGPAAPRRALGSTGETAPGFRRQ